MDLGTSILPTSHQVPQIRISTLTHRVTQNLYKTLHSLLDTLSSSTTTPHHRRVGIHDYALKSLYRIVRLLVNIRWTMDYSAFHMSATRALMLAQERIGRVQGGVERVYWSYEGQVKGAKMVEIDVEGVVGILGTGGKGGLPRAIVEGFVGRDKEDRITQRKAGGGDGPRKTGQEHLVRLGMMTRLLVRLGIRASRYTRVLNWEDGVQGTCVTIGVENAWSVSLIATSLDVKKAVLCAQSVKVYIGSSAGITGDTKDESFLNRDQEQALMAAVDERVFWEINKDIKDENNNSYENNNSFEKKDDMVVKRAEKMVRAVVEVVNGEVAAPLAMEILKSQAWKLARNRRKLVRIQSMEPVRKFDYTEENAPRVLLRPNLELGMWGGRRNFSVQMVSGDGSGNMVDILHEPELQTSRLSQISPNQLSLESFLQDIAMERAKLILSNVRDSLYQANDLRDDSIGAKNASDDLHRTAIKCIFRADGILPPTLIFPLRLPKEPQTSWRPKAVLELGIDLWTGNFKLRLLEDRQLPPKLAMSITNLRSWNEENRSYEAERGEVIRLLKLVLSWMYKDSQNEEQKRCFHASDVSFLRGTLVRDRRTQVRWTEVGTSPHFSLENLSLLRFGSKFSNGDDALFRLDSKSSRNKVHTEGKLFPSTSDSEDVASGSSQKIAEANQGGASSVFVKHGACASSMAAAVVYYEYTTLLIRKSIILRVLEKQGLIRARQDVRSERGLLSSGVGSVKSVRDGKIFVPSLKIQAPPLPVESASLCAEICGAWRVTLNLEKSEDYRKVSGELSRSKAAHMGRISQSGRVICLSYRDFTKFNLKAFLSDILKLRVNYSLCRGVFLRRHAAHFQISDYSLTGLSVQPKFQGPVSSLLSKIELRAWYPDQHIRIECSPSLGHQRVYLEELLNAARDNSGEVLVALLHIAVPLGVAVEAFRRALSGRVRYRTCLHLRIQWRSQGGRHGQVGLELDGRNMTKGVRPLPLPRGQESRCLRVIDLGGAGKSAYDEIKRWGSVVEGMTRLDSATQQLSRSSLLTRIEHLPKFLKALITK